MNMVRLLGSLGVAGLFAVASVPALAQDSTLGSSPNVVCGLINFAFCPQTPPIDVAAPPPPPVAQAAPMEPPMPAHHKRTRKHKATPDT